MTKRGIDYLNSAEKRQLDLAACAALALPWGSLAVVSGVVAAIDTRVWWPVLSQRRRGRDGDFFTTFKLHTIRPERTVGAFATYGTFDPRATRTGLLLRRFGLDELPQIINVVRGEMSMVGPRPSTPLALEKYQRADPVLFDEWYDTYAKIRPGIFGESQMYRRLFTEISEDMRRRSMAQDMRYFEAATLTMDMAILARALSDLVVVNMGVVEGPDFEPYPRAAVPPEDKKERPIGPSYHLGKIC